MRFCSFLSDELGYVCRSTMELVADMNANSRSDDLSVEEVLRAHFLIADHFLKEGEGIGGVGVKSIDLLISAVCRQNSGYGGVQKWNSVYDKAATLLYGLIMNHPFHDANKRTAFLSTVHYLYKNGYVYTKSERELEDFTVYIAEKNLSKFRRYKELRGKSADPEVEYISHYLKKSTRIIDRTQYLITYRELDAILRKYDAWLDHPKGNQIDVMQKYKEEKIEKAGWFKTKIVEVDSIRRVCVLGFPGWTKTIEQGRLKHVRRELNLTPEFGVDSQAFFKGLDDMKVLAQMYEGALRRLADR